MLTGQDILFVKSTPVLLGMLVDIQTSSFMFLHYRSCNIKLPNFIIFVIDVIKWIEIMHNLMVKEITVYCFSLI